VATPAEINGVTALVVPKFLVDTGCTGPQRMEHQAAGEAG
jgi:hypothetical protein